MLLIGFWARLALTGRLLLLTAITLLVAGTVSLTISVQNDSRSLNANLQTSLDNQLSILPSALSEMLVIGDFASVQQTLNRFVENQPIEKVVFRDTSGISIEAKGKLSGLKAPLWYDSFLGVRNKYGQANAVIGGRNYGTIEITFSSIPSVNQSWHDWIHEVQYFLVVLSLNLFGFWLLLWVSLRPLKNLDEGSRLLAEGKLDISIKPEGSSEVRNSILAFNQMAAAISQNQKTLAADEERFRRIIEASPEPLILSDNRQNIVFLNDAFIQTFGYNKSDIPTLTVWNAKAYPDAGYRRWVADTWQERLDLAQQEGRKFEPMEVRICCKDGAERTVLVGATPIGISTEPVNLVVLYDITERKNVEAEFRIAATAFESREGMFITDANRCILRANHAFCAITGYSPEDVIGKNPNVLSSGRHDDCFYAAMWDSINENGTWVGEIWDRRKSGEVFPEHLAITAVKDKEGRVTNYVASLADITMRKAAEDEIKNLAFFDPLTKLPNRRLLLDRLQQAMSSSERSGKEGALLFIDLDNFKTLNDTLGHDIGDLLLQKVAQRLEACVRAGDTVARLGGDEFVIMLENLSELALEAAEQTKGVGNKILNALNQPYQLANHLHHCTSSIGATLFSEHKAEIEELFKQADIAMYQAKKSGRNALRFFDPQMQENINARAAIENDLRKAILNHEFKLYYQTQMDSAQRPFGAEALIRWIHPVHGLVPPDDFIPQAEESGLILPIGQWVLETACAQLKDWQQFAFTRDLILSINVSAKQFHQADFAAHVDAAVKRHAIDPTRLKIELTESLLQESIEDTISTMNALKEIGVKFTLDDFGTGYSSLQYIKQLPLDQFKIDKSFVRDIASDNSDQAIVRTIIGMAQSLNLGCTAEGVETEEQRQVLISMGCTNFQGYLLGRPVPIKQFDDQLKQS